MQMSKQSVKGMAWFLLSAYSKIQEEKEKLKKEVLCKKKRGLEALENSQPIHIETNKQTKQERKNVF